MAKTKLKAQGQIYKNLSLSQKDKNIRVLGLSKKIFFCRNPGPFNLALASSCVHAWQDEGQKSLFKRI
jgi:hypothetical protein